MYFSKFSRERRTLRCRPDMGRLFLLRRFHAANDEFYSHLRRSRQLFVVHGDFVDFRFLYVRLK